ncbi:MAG: glutathione S-transferase family protein [Pseudolabrys sp.]|nr:glutathione S-transferase family protein [Pseudolabrys sp.]
MSGPIASTRPLLLGFPPSTFTQTAALTLFEKGVDFDFSIPDPENDAYDVIHPFRKVPALTFGDTVIFETMAICVYADENFAGPRLQPEGPERYAMIEWISAFLDYYRQALVRGVINEVFIKPTFGMETDAARLAADLASAEPLLAVLDRQLTGRSYLASEQISLADLFFAPPLHYVALFDDGGRMLARYAEVTRWLRALVTRRSFQRLQELAPTE